MFILNVYFKCLILNVITDVIKSHNRVLFSRGMVTYDYYMTDISNICFTSYSTQSIMLLIRKIKSISGRSPHGSEW